MNRFMVSCILTTSLAVATLAFWVGAWITWGQLSALAAELRTDMGVLGMEVFCVMFAAVTTIALVENTYRVVEGGRLSEESIGGMEGYHPILIIALAALLPVFLVVGTLYMMNSTLLPKDSLVWIAVTALAAWFVMRWYHTRSKETRNDARASD